jgi:hypothetical protein
MSPPRSPRSSRRPVAEQLLAMIGPDVDVQNVLEYRGKSFRSHVNVERKLITHALDFVRTQHDHFTLAAISSWPSATDCCANTSTSAATSGGSRATRHRRACGRGSRTVRDQIVRAGYSATA